MERIINNWIKSLQKSREQKRQNNFFKTILKPVKL
jgi:hypothetical protein